MKNKIFLFLFTGLFFMLTNACSNKTIDMLDSNVTEEMAQALANPDNGMTAEENDMMNLVTSDCSNTYYSRTFVITTTNGQLSNFTWDAPSNGYIRTASNLNVTTSNFSGILSNAWVFIQFFESTDATGTPVQLTNANITNNPNIRSMKYKRIANGSITSTLTSIVRYFNANTELTTTGINDGVEGAFVSGTNTRSVHVSTGVRTGDWTLTFTANNLNAARQVDGNTRYTSLEGTVNGVYDGTFSGPRGMRTVHSSAEINFTGQRTVTISSDGSTITVEIDTGTTH
jgi:hypothetical protein